LVVLVGKLRSKLCILEISKEQVYGVGGEVGTMVLTELDDDGFVDEVGDVEFRKDGY
jgi:hypothetical protein